MAGYAGDVTPQQAWELVRDGAVLVDVRTVGEWQQIGVPDTSELGAETHFIEWVHAGGIPNEAFLDQLNAIEIDKDQTVLFLCRSGQRSIGAAMTATQAGYTNSYNVLQGFEGSADKVGTRDVEGWKVAGLPWKFPE